MSLNHLLFVLFCCLISSCSGGKFLSAYGSKASSNDQAPPCDVSGDFIKLNFPPAIQSCVNQGNIYNFSNGSCTDVSVASFQCDFASLESAIEQLGPSDADVKQAQSRGAKLVSCGQKNNGQIIVAQWIIGPPGCVIDTSKTASIVTSCYRLYSGPAPAIPTDAAGRQAFVDACIAGSN